MSEHTVVQFIGEGEVLYKDGTPILQREKFELGELCEALGINYELSGDSYYRSHEKILKEINIL
jgi:hypothetical protein